MIIPFKQDGQRITENVELIDFLPRQTSEIFKVAYIRAFGLDKSGRCGYGVFNCSPDAPENYREHPPELFRTTNLMHARDVAQEFDDLRAALNASPTPQTINASHAWFYDSLDFDFWAGFNRWREISQEDYMYALGVLPPMDQRGSSFLVCEPYTENVHAGFTAIHGRYFARYVDRSQFHAEVGRLAASL
jgi:hypothetical protein